MPRRIPQYPDAFIGWNWVSSWGSILSVISVIVGLYSVHVQLNNGENELEEIQVTPDFTESNLTRSQRSSDLELILDRPAGYHTYLELAILYDQNNVNLIYLYHIPPPKGGLYIHTMPPRRGGKYINNIYILIFYIIYSYLPSPPGDYIYMQVTLTPPKGYIYLFYIAALYIMLIKGKLIYLYYDI